eukprot:NODE_3778_length_732_cov_160.945827_g3181_i0.p1 GENE.NODE_3778_length_732_cov_160.945827_g3181_i0~~NODE_3778_length_732_cov_160.945827_g3181_i0.p1  ORF type:complete len:214 (-),score=34.40 NODE_3778_length_732_cov_160.945827_g3181_i0:89-649(-)
MRFLRRIRNWDYRHNHRLIRLKRPTRPEKARRLGYAAKQGFSLFRIRIRRGGRKRHCRKGIVYGKPRNAGINHIKLQKSHKEVAEARVGRALGSLRLLGSYIISDEARYKYFECIMVDPMHKAIRRDPRINWIVKSVHKHREMRGLTSAGKKHRGLRAKGKRATKARPSHRAAWKRQNTLKFWRYR